MDWAAELRQAFGRLGAGEAAQVGFAGRADTIGELGREFNALSAELEEAGPSALSREQAHRLRNRLAGILAALHLLKESGELSPQEETALRQAVAAAQLLDARLRAG